MIGKSRSTGSLFFRDLSSLLPVSYVIMLDPSGAEFLRLTSKERPEILVRHSCCTNDVAQVRAFIAALAAGPCYFGQPVTVLIDNDRVFTYLKRLANLTPIQILNKLKFIQSEQFHFSYIVKQTSSGDLLICQAVAKDYLAAVDKAAAEHCVGVLGICTLAAFLAFHGQTPPLASMVVHKYQWFPSYVTDIIFDDKDNIVFGSGISNNGRCASEPLSGRMARLYRSCDCDIETKQYEFRGKGRCDVPRGSDLGRLFKKGLRGIMRMNGLCIRTHSFRSMRVVAVAGNSARLLVLIAAMIAVLALAVAGAAAILAEGGDEAAARYQERYATKLVLTQKLDSLHRIEVTLLDKVPRPTNAAAIISAFCQKCPQGLFLTRLTMTTSDSDSTLVVVAGTAESESIIFDYHRAINELVLPNHLDINSIRPVSGTALTAGKTSLNFTMSMIIYGRSSGE